MQLFLLRQERSTDGGIQTIRDHIVRWVLQTTKKLHKAIQNKRPGMLTYSLVLLHENVCPNTAAHT
jgi:hypothetical protein